VQIEGTYAFKAKRQAVWDAFQSPKSLTSCIPGCERFEPDGEGGYDVSMKVSIGPITGAYRAKITLSEQQAPSSFKMAVRGSGTGGTIAGEGMLTLAEKDGGTEVTVRGDAQVGGVVARVGQRLLGSASKSLLDKFFSCIASKIEG